MKTKMLKKVLVVVLVLSMVSVPLFSFAGDAGSKEYWDGITSGGNDGGLGNFVTSLGGGLLGVVRMIAYMLALGLLIWLGVKWMLASAQEKADIKKNAWGYVIGAILIFGASSILPVIVNFANSMGQ